MRTIIFLFSFLSVCIFSYAQTKQNNILCGITVVASSNVTICSGHSTTMSANATSGTAPYSYAWSPSSGLNNANISNPVATPAANTTYTCIVTDAASCTGKVSVTVTVKASPTISVSGINTICPGHSTTLTASGGTTYSWAPGGLTPTSIVVSPATNTTYTVTGTNANGCTNTSTYNVTVSPLSANAGTNGSLCEGSTTTLNGTGIGTYSWSPSGSLSCSNCAIPTANPTVTTTYTFSVTNSCGTANSTVTIIVDPLPPVSAGPNQTILEGTSTILQGSGAVKYFWSPTQNLTYQNTATPAANPVNTTTYCVTAVDNHGCKNSKCMVLDVIPSDTIVLYNAFSPNGDGVNDIFYISNIEKYPNNQLEVYNRNGKLVYQASPYNNDWKGTIDGNDLPCATYYFILDLGNGNQKRHGSVTIIR